MSDSIQIIQDQIDEDRYARHRLIDWWDQARLRSGRVMVVGAGAIGNEVIKLLALSGVGQILIVDFDRIEPSNLSRSVLFRATDVGRLKAEVAAERAREIDPSLNVRFLAADLETQVGLGVYRAMDIVIGCLDSIDARLALNRACALVGVPWLNGGIEATDAEIALYDGGEGACFECQMSPEMWDQRSRRFSCSGLQTDLPADRAPTTAVVASICAGYLVHEALLALHRVPHEPSNSSIAGGLRGGQKLFLALRPYGFYAIDQTRYSGCLAHERYEPVELLELSPQRVTLAEVLAALGMPDGQVELGFDLLTRMRCVQCGRIETVLRPLERCGASLIHCETCEKASRQPETVHCLDASSEWAGRMLAELGVPDHQILIVKARETRRFVQLTGIYS